MTVRFVRFVKCWWVDEWVIEQRARERATDVIELEERRDWNAMIVGFRVRSVAGLRWPRTVECDRCKFVVLHLLSQTWRREAVVLEHGWSSRFDKYLQLARNVGQQPKNRSMNGMNRAEATTVSIKNVGEE